MARAEQAWSLRPRGPQKILHVRFRFDGARVEESTGTRDPRTAKKVAAQIYARHVTDQPRRAERAPRLPLDELVARWLAHGLDGTHAASTRKLYEIHMRAHIIPFFARLDAITMGGIADYSRARLKKVARATVRKERGTLSTFLHWCHEQEILHALPQWPTLPRGATGTRASKRKSSAVAVSPDQVAAFLAALPELSTGKLHGSKRFIVRQRFVVAWETGLRPSTIDRLSVPEHYQRGASELVITDEIDKARYGRKLPLTEAARAALDASAPRSGLIFGHHEHRQYVERAAKQASMPTGFSPYDLRHARALLLTEESGNLPGVAFMLGHKQVTTTNLYVRSPRRAADEVIASLGARRGGKGPDKAESAPESRAQTVDIIEGVRRRGLEPLRCYPLAPQSTDIRENPRETSNLPTAENRKIQQLAALAGGMPPELPGLAKATRALVIDWDLLELAVGDEP